MYTNQNSPLISVCLKTELLHNEIRVDMKVKAGLRLMSALLQ